MIFIIDFWIFLFSFVFASDVLLTENKIGSVWQSLAILKPLNIYALLHPIFYVTYCYNLFHIMMSKKSLTVYIALYPSSLETWPTQLKTKTKQGQNTKSYGYSF